MITRALKQTGGMTEPSTPKIVRHRCPPVPWQLRAFVYYRIWYPCVLSVMLPIPLMSVRPPTMAEGVL